MTLDHGYSKLEKDLERAKTVASIIDMRIKGLSVPEIASSLHLKEHTVNSILTEAKEEWGIEALND